ncbi:MAG: hypothetical protein QM451_02510 [Bacillota bacterium]|jgi:hypothetical protein|nr:hypothetical protein [Bacillota bacterium]HHT91153.1 hypothetical protein [Bacillota bacterium]
MMNVDLIDQRRQQQRVKVPMVIDKDRCVQVIGRTEIDGPANLSFVHGRFESGGEHVLVQLVLSTRPPELLSTTIIPGKVLNTGVVYVDLVITSLTGTKLASKQEIPILWHDLVPSPGAMPGDMVQKHDFEIEGFEDVVGYCDCEGRFRLVLAVVVRYCLVIAAERILRVEAAETFC